MDIFVIDGGKSLKGSISIGGAKNAAVAIIPAAILSNDICTIENLPNISDVDVILDILAELNVEVKRISSSSIQIDARHVTCSNINPKLANDMRGSYYLLGAMLGAFNCAKVPMPGGCYFGLRPIDQHLKGFEALGAKSRVRDGIVRLDAENGLKGSRILLDVVSVGATINIMLAAVKAEGLTIIENVAKEPHIVDLANFLNSMGADVRGAGTDVIKIRGVKKLHGTTYSIIPDQIEAGTYMIAAAVNPGSDIYIRNVIPKHLEYISKKLREMNIKVEDGDDFIHVTRLGRPTSCNVVTMPHPGFPTDMQPQMAVLMSLADGTSTITEGVWESRFQYLAELRKFGALAEDRGRIATFNGIERLNCASVMATDLRGGAAMIIAAIAASGTSYIYEGSHIERGYENIVEKLSGVGATIKCISIPDASDAVDA